jgi:mono/diheme cytochrome c family protein
MLKSRFNPISRCIGALLAVASSMGAFGDDSLATYTDHIRPLLRQKCVACHGPLRQEAGLRLDAGSLILSGGDSGAAVVPGSPDESLLLARVAATDPEERMPPEAEPLTAEQLVLLHDWIASGANSPADETPLPDPRRHWSFQPIAQEFRRHSIDEFIGDELDRAGLAAAPEADRVTLIRRLSLDLHGVPPTPQEIADFVADDAPDAWPRLVDRLLANPRFGERWAQHWLDVVRYADTHGFEVNTPREHAWPYRDWVIRAVNDDLPYDEFVKQQIAGDAFGADAATGFLVASAVLLPGQIGADDASKRLARQDALDEMIVGTSNAFLGLTLGCARCHDHKFDPLTAVDYYSLQACFAGVEYDDREIEDADYEERLKLAEELDAPIDEARALLASCQPRVFAGRTLLIDDEDADKTASLVDKNGHGDNPEGEELGYRDYEGDADHHGNIGKGRYTWWTNHPGQDVFVYKPGIAGRFQLWISWGAHGSGVHTRDARYLLDSDGDLATTDDQQELARIDQYYPAGVTEGETEQTPLWSGLLNVGAHDWTDESVLILRGGDTGTGITADAIVLQEVLDEPEQGEATAIALPRLRVPVNARENEEHIAPVTAKFVRFTSLETIDDNLHEPCIDELDVWTTGDDSHNLALASAGAIVSSSGDNVSPDRHELRFLNDGEYGNSRSWMSNELGRGWCQVEFAEAAEINRIVWGRDRNSEYSDRLAVQYRIEVSRDGENWTQVAGHDDRLPYEAPHEPTALLVRDGHAPEGVNLEEWSNRLHDLEARLEELTQPTLVFAGLFREPDETFLLNRGDPEQRQRQLTPAVPAILGSIEFPSDGEEQSRRVALAEWLADDGNPLVARVIVNRVWQQHFGRGLVSTPNDFGVNGSPPSHPELLDWLARELIEHDWSLKHIHRLILSSQTYRQSSRIDPAAQIVDADCRLLWRYPSRRLEAEAIRDSLLVISGQFNDAMYGPGYSFFGSRGGLDGFKPREDFNAEGLRRFIYAHRVRMERVPVFGAFDCPDAGQSMPERGRSTTAIQALNLFNSPFAVDTAEQFAGRVLADVGDDDPTSQVQQVFALALGRPPTENELRAATALVKEHGLDQICRAVINSSEFLFLP